MLVTRRITVEETYELPDDIHPKVAAEMLKKSEKWGRPYTPTKTRVVRYGRWNMGPKK